MPPPPPPLRAKPYHQLEPGRIRPGSGYGTRLQTPGIAWIETPHGHPHRNPPPLDIKLPPIYTNMGVEKCPPQISVVQPTTPGRLTLISTLLTR